MAVIRRARHTTIAVLVSLFATLAFVHWPPMPPSPQALLDLPLNLFGPFNTAANGGYENLNHVSPIVPNSYDASVGPNVVGLQFIGDATSALKSDQFQVQIHGGSYQGTRHTLNVFSQGFAGWKLPRPLKPGAYQVTFDVTGFDTPAQRWTITIRKPVPVPTREPSTAAILLDSLNTLRSPLKLGRVTWNPHLQLASRAHSQYLAKNGYEAPSFHMELPSHAGYTGKTPWDRDMVFGWPTPVAGEVGIEWTQPSEPVTVVQDLVDTVYHRLSLFSDNLIAAGEGEAAGNGGSVVMDLGFGYRSTLPFAVVYPYNGQPGVPTGWVDIESPDPVKNGYEEVFGYPITADFPTVDQLSRVHVRLTLGNRRVPFVLDPPGVNGMGANQVGLVPRNTLKPESLYTVQVNAWARFNDGTSHPVDLSWSFATGGASQSLAATVESSHEVVISDVTAGAGTPIPYQGVTLYRRIAGRPLQRVKTGETNVDGIWTVTRLKGAPGYYEAVTATHNATVFWWGSHG